MSKTPKDRLHLHHTCYPRSVSASIIRGEANFVVPEDTGMVDAVLTQLLALDPATDEIMINGMALLNTSERAVGYVKETAHSITNTFLSCLTDQTRTMESRAKEVAQCTIGELTLTLSIGFLMGTAIGFAAGLKFEPVDGDDEDGEDDPGPDYDGPMV